MAANKKDKTAEAPAPAPVEKDPREYAEATDKPDESTIAQVEKT
jgi:hypothetical protein